MNFFRTKDTTDTTDTTIWKPGLKKLWCCIVRELKHANLVSEELVRLAFGAFTLYQSDGANSRSVSFISFQGGNFYSYQLV